MATPDPPRPSHGRTHDPKPRDTELDLFGLTDPGKQRAENQDHFLISTVHQQVVIHGTSLPDAERLPLRGERLASLLLVADGVGGGSAGREASQLAAETITRYVSSTMRCFQAMDASNEEEFFEALRAAISEAHAAVRAEGAKRGLESMATTLTLWLGVWPWAYVTQVGDSRCYHYHDGVLQQVTRDQTIAQSLVDQGALAPESVAQSGLSHVLSSAIGGPEASPEVKRVGLDRASVVVLCTDGLARHVSDAEIEARIRATASSEELCRSLLEMALDRGGSDNVTIVAGRLKAT